MAAGDWKTAAGLSTTLKDAVREARDRSFSVSNAEQIGSVLSWLPENTETILVAQQPFTVVQEKRQTPIDAASLARQYIMNVLDPLQEEHALRSLDGITLRYAVLAGRNFKNHLTGDSGALPLGMIAFEGCGVYAFASAIPDNMFSQPPNVAILGQYSWSVRHQLDEQPSDAPLIYDTFFAAKIKPDILLACNDEDFFSSVISQLSTAPHTSRFEALPEWKQTGTAAAVWGLRHFNPASATTDPTYPIDKTLDKADSGAIGIVVQVGAPPGTIRARFLSTSKDNPLDEIAKLSEFRDAVTMRRPSEGVFELSVNDRGNAGYAAIFAIMSMLGFAVLL
jgi:hypothetical protein